MKTFILGFIFIFVQAAQADFNILAVGDTGKGNRDQSLVGTAMAQTCQRNACKFALLLGDNIYDVGLSSPQDTQMVDKFERPYAGVEVPFYVALGNHDYGKFANDWKKGDYQVEYGKINKKYVLPSHYYSFAHDNALFIVLDTSRLFHGKDVERQLQFVKDALARNQKKWVVVVAHHPYISNGPHGNAGNYDGVPFPPYSGIHIKDFFEKHLCAVTDLFISGHDHFLQTLPGSGLCKQTLFVVSGGGASTGEDNQLKGKNPYYFQKAMVGFTSLHFTDKTLKIAHLGINQQVEHSYTIEKSDTKLSPWTKVGAPGTLTAFGEGVNLNPTQRR